jgi:hypothetical protein
MSPEDLAIWQRYFPLIRDEITSMYFDVYLGNGLVAPADAPPNYRRMWLKNTQKRADVIVTVGAEVWLIELRYAASSSAIGRLLMYKQLYLLDPVLGQNLRLILVTDQYDQDVELAANAASITYLIV